MMKKLVICILLLTLGAAFEMYDENRAFGMDQSGDENYNEENYDYQSLGPYRPDIRDDATQKLILYHLFHSMQDRDVARLHMAYRPKYRIMENPLTGYGHVPYSELMDFQGAVAKRHAGNNYHKVKPETPKPAKDDVKIIRKGPFWVCYLKLCSYPDIL